MKKEAKRIFDSTLSKEDKKEKLDQIIEDCLIEMDADDQNMHPEVDHEIAEGLKTAKKFLCELDIQLRHFS